MSPGREGALASPVEYEEYRGARRSTAEHCERLHACRHDRRCVASHGGTLHCVEPFDAVEEYQLHVQITEFGCKVKWGRQPIVVRSECACAILRRHLCRPGVDVSLGGLWGGTARFTCWMAAGGYALKGERAPGGRDGPTSYPF
eukprot:4271655-Prymnesium_polylepis.1